MTITEEMKYGLYGQILLWILEILPYLNENNIKPKWEITSPYYGNIFGEHILLNYEPDDESNEVTTLTNIKSTNTTHFGNDFKLANELWNKYFIFSDKILDNVSNYVKGLNMEKTLGLHYRGTDKINTEGGYIDVKNFTDIVDDYLKTNNIDNIIIFSDEKNVLINLINYYKNNYTVVYNQDFYNSNNDDILFSNNTINNVDIDKHYMDCLNEMLVLSKCSAVFKTSSQLSAWSKIINPDMVIYRISSFIYDWFPDSRIQLYKSEDTHINELLSNLYKNESIK
jgi:hypothetical protein